MNNPLIQAASAPKVLNEFLLPKPFSALDLTLNIRAESPAGI